MMRLKMVILFNIFWLISITSASILQPLVDVKGNGAIRQIRLLYDLYDEDNGSSSKAIISSTPSNIEILSRNLETRKNFSLILLNELNTVNNSNISSNSGNYRPGVQVVYPWSTGTGIDATKKLLTDHWPSSTSTSSSMANYNYYYPSHHLHHHHQLHHQDAMGHQKHQQQNRQWSSKFNTINRSPLWPLSSKILHQNHHQPQQQQQHHYHYLIRGRPLFAEIDIVPRYIPQYTRFVVISVTLPSNIRGRPWILGYHQEEFPLPSCRLCTNEQKSYTLPITLFLSDDGWCPEGPVQTIWKVEAIQQYPQQLQQQKEQQQPKQYHSNSILAKAESITSGEKRFDQTDLILAYGYDNLRQLYLKNDQNSTKSNCYNRNEAIIGAAAA